MSAFAGLLLSLVVPHSGALDQDRLVSATVRGALAPKAIADLSKQIGVPLAAMPSVKNDVLVIRVKDVPLKALLDRVAKVIHGSWEQVDDGYRLVRTDANRQKEKSDDVVYETELFRKGLEAKRKALADMGELDQKKADYITTRLKSIQERMNPTNGTGIDWQSTQQITDQSPANRAISRILASFRPEDLARLPSEHKTVFSNQPTRMQVLMPVNLKPILAQFKRELDLMSESNKRIFNQQEMSWSVGDQSLYGRGGSGTPTKVLLSFSKFAMIGGLQIQLQIANEKGRVIGSGYGNLTRDWSAQQKALTDLMKQSENEESLKLTPESEAYQKGFALAMQGKPNPTPLSNDLIQKLLKPEENDPLSFAATDVLFEVGRIKNLNVVASPPDQLTAGLAFSAMNAKPATVLYMINQPEVGGKIEDGWLTLEPNMQSVNREHRLDRPSLGACIRACYKKGKMTLDDMAAFAIKNKWEDAAWMVQGMLGALGQANNRNQGWNWDTLRLYGLLTPTQRRFFDTKRPMPLQNLNPEQQAIVHKMVFDSPYTNLNITMEYDPSMAATNAEDMEYFYGGLGREPTEAMPNGVPFDGTLTVNFNTDSVLFLGNVEGNQSWMSGRAFTPTELAWEVFQRQRKDLFPWMNDPGFQSNLPTDNLRSGERLLIAFHFQFTKNLSFDQQLQENTYGNGSSFSLSNMPASFKKAFDVALAQHTEQYKNVKPGDFQYQRGNQQTVPPR